MNMNRRLVPMLALTGTLLFSAPIMAADLIVNLGHEKTLTLDVAMQNAHHGEPGFRERWAENF